MQISLKAAKFDRFLLEIDAASHGIYDGLGLFKDFLLHEMRIGALHDLRKFQL